ncbi:MAG: hypothetical protein HY403_12700 [Elusimicrobia bacterium]|nr:hypothetical protein [Elusimicrobiota bacterium]
MSLSRRALASLLSAALAALSGGPVWAQAARVAASPALFAGAPALPQAAPGALDLSKFDSPLTGAVSLTPALAEDALARAASRSPESDPASLPSAEAERLERRLQSASAAPGSAAAVLEFQQLAHEALDALIVLETRPGTPDEALRRRLTSARAEAEERFAAESARLLEANAERMEREARSLGRTRLLDVDGGAVLAAKEQYHREHESAMMSRSRLFGLPAPTPLPGRAEENTLYYLVPPALAPDYFAYLGDRLNLPRAERGARVRAAALKAVDQLSSLQRHGHRHQSLAALSHSEGTWEWDYWRTNTPYFALLRFGPTSIHNWRSALAFPNLRLSGIADHEHIEVVSAEDVGHLRDGIREYEPARRFRLLGQNLTEWSFVVMQAGLKNGLSARWAADLLAEGLWRWGERFLPGGLPPGADRSLLRRAAGSAARRHYAFALLSAALPQFVSDAANAVVDMHVASALKRGEAPAMPGALVAPLVLDAVRPLAEAASKQPVSISDLAVVTTRSGRIAADNLFDLFLELAAVVAALTIFVGVPLAAFGLVSWGHLVASFFAGLAAILVWNGARLLIYSAMRRRQARRASSTWLNP